MNVNRAAFRCTQIVMPLEYTYGFIGSWLTMWIVWAIINAGKRAGPTVPKTKGDENRGNDELATRNPGTNRRCRGCRLPYERSPSERRWR